MVNYGSHVDIKEGSLSEIMKQFSDVVEADVLMVSRQVGKKVAEDTVKRLKADTKAKFKGKRYSMGWKAQSMGDGEWIVYNATQPSLTHLLEHGHDVVRRGRVVGRTKGVPHMKPAEQQAIQDYYEETVKEINRRLSEL